MHSGPRVQEQVFRYGWIEVAHVKGDKCVFFLFWDCLEPFYGVVSAFPQVHLGCLDDFFVYAVEDVFADDTNFRFAWINESAGRVVNEIWFVVFQCNEGVP